MPVFPSYISRNQQDAVQAANRRVFNIERNQDSGSSAESTVSAAAPPKSGIYAMIEKIDVKQLSADDVLPELEKEIRLADTLGNSVIESIRDWNIHHDYQYERKPYVEIEDAHPFEAEEENYPGQTREQIDAKYENLVNGNYFDTENKEKLKIPKYVMPKEVEELDKFVSLLKIAKAVLEGTPFNQENALKSYPQPSPSKGKPQLTDEQLAERKETWLKNEKKKHVTAVLAPYDFTYRGKKYKFEKERSLDDFLLDREAQLGTAEAQIAAAIEAGTYAINPDYEVAKQEFMDKWTTAKNKVLRKETGNKMAYQEALRNRNADKKEKHEDEFAYFKKQHKTINYDSIPKNEQVFQSRKKSVNKYFNGMSDIAKNILTEISKLNVVSNNVKIIYKYKIGKSKITQYSNEDLIKVRSLIEEFLENGRKIEKELRDSGKAILDSSLLKNFFFGVDEDGEEQGVVVAFHHAYDEISKKYNELMKSVEVMVKQDFNHKAESGSGRRRI